MKKTWTERHFGRFVWLGWAICLTATLFYAYEYLLRISPSVMSQQLRIYFIGMSAGGLGALTSIYYWSYAPMQIVVGVAVDRYGPRLSLLVAILLCAVGNYLFTLVPNVYVAGVGRFIVGMGSAFAFVGVLKLAALWLPKKYFPFFSGLTMAVAMLAAIIGDNVLSWLVLAAGWNYVVLILSLLGLVLFALFFLLIHEKSIPKSRRKKRNSLGYMFKEFFKILITGKYLIVGFVGCFLYVSLAAFADMWGIPFLKEVYPGRPLMASWVNTMVFLGWLVGAPVITFIASKLNQRVLPLRYGALLSGILFCFVIAFPKMPLALMMIVLFFFGFFTSAETLCFAIAKDYVSLRMAASAMAAVNLVIMLSGFILQPLMAGFLDLVWNGQKSGGIPIYTLSEYRLAMITIPVALFLAFILSLWIHDPISRRKS